MAELLTSDERERVLAPLQQAWTLPPRAYTDPAVFEREVEAIFAQEWVCVARAEQIADVGDYVCVDLVDQPLVLTRAEDGTIHALSRICLHRAMPLVHGSGNARRLTCPYHRWSYDLDGRLRQAPLMDGAEDFTPGECRLPSLHVEEWQGFVFVSMAAAPAPLAPRLEKLHQYVAPYGFDELRIVETIEFDSPWNWKILVENFMEAYHHIGTHNDTFERVYKAKDSSVLDNDDEPWAYLHMPGHLAYDEPDGLPFFPGVPREWRGVMFAASVFPTLLFGATASTAVWYQLTPHGHDHMTLRIHILLRPEVAAVLDEESREHLREGISAIHLEDIDANVGPWRGLNAPMTGQGRLSPYEKAIWQLNRWWLERLEGAAPDRAGA